ncbi:unnamed protein product [Lepeophtheirus salmonis]|uniref:(salmon louse) hypothetical protein n=1 Tax=Lepeophtheirus salmonis TaxID=72036 RepID=A0A7R8CQL1_LEPSM|nr:unnamed protein product [Lepeophtheirus salmonis]CAF2848013.1 unnamed protein product [Lepeophtheirus salmonis]
MRKSFVKENVPMVKTNFELVRVTGIDHGHSQIQTNVEEAHDDDDEDYHYGRRQRNFEEARIEDEIVRGSHVEDVSNSNEDVFSKYGENPNVQDQNCPKVGGNFETIDPNSGKWLQGKFIGRAGKANGRYRRFYNVRNNGIEEEYCVDIDIWKEWKVVEDDHEVLFILTLEK